MSAWTIWPTLSATVIFASSAWIRDSIAGSGGSGELPFGHCSGWTVVASPAMAGTVMSNTPASDTDMETRRRNGLDGGSNGTSRLQAGAPVARVWVAQ